jgi:hypothetical protein
LYLTSLEKGNRRAFRAVIQDMDAFADAGTPTCISWQQTVDVFERGDLPLDRLLLVTCDVGGVIAVEGLFSRGLDRQDSNEGEEDLCIGTG